MIERAIMGRPRTIQPKLFTHEGLFDAEQESGLPLRLAFAGLFTEADREGRFQWRPRTLKAAILPFDDVDFSAVLDALEAYGFIVRYHASGTREARVKHASTTRGIDENENAEKGELLGWIPRFRKHQQINPKEGASELEAPSEELVNQYLAHACGTREARVSDASTRARARGFAAKSLKAKSKSSSSTRERAREAPDEAPSGGLPAESEAVSDVLDASDAGKLAGALRYAGIAASPSHPKLREAAMHGVSVETLALAIPHAIAEKQGEGKKPSVPFVIAIAERMHAEGLDVPEGLRDAPGTVHAMPVRASGLRYPLTPAQQYREARKAVHDGIRAGFDEEDGRTIDMPAKEISDERAEK